MRVAVVDMGTNSTRLLVADVRDGRVTELDRRSIVTRLGEGVDADGRLGEAPRERVLAALDEYAAAMEEHGCDARTAVMTSAVRDASNGAEFQATVAERYGLPARTISGDEEARLTYAGATAVRSRRDDTPLLVVDIGGGSTELVTGRRGEVEFHASTQVGVVRQAERHIAHDPPRPGELEALAADARSALDAAVPVRVRDQTRAAVAVAGTATSAAAIDLGRFDRERVEGHRLTATVLRGQLERLAALPLSQRREVPGLHPDRAVTIVAGVAILLEVLGSFGLDAVEVSDRDILWGAALDAAGA